jgi:AraC-like DNA-binding protein
MQNENHHRAVMLVKAIQSAKVLEWERLAAQSGFRVALLAEICSLSTRQLERRFAVQLNTSPHRWMRELQCRLAKELIGRGEQVKSVASDLNFRSTSHLCREFKRLYGAPPKRYLHSWNGD